jgi:hypothetical protein
MSEEKKKAHGLAVGFLLDSLDGLAYLPDERVSGGVGVA